MYTLDQINALLNQPNTFQRNLEQLVLLSQKFVSLYEAPGCDNGDGSLSDELRPMLATMSDPSATIPVEMELILSSILKILLRKSSNRLALGKAGMTSILRSLNRILTERNIKATAELCNAVLNTCYDGVNVQFLIELDGVSLLMKLLNSRDTELITSALGALQGLCYEPRGRQSVRQDLKVSIKTSYFIHRQLLSRFSSAFVSQAIPKIATFLSNENEHVRARAVGAVHNLSVDVVSIAPLVECRCIPALVVLLRDPSIEICRAATGTIQNLSRDISVRASIVDSGALDYLSDLLFANDITCQVKPS